MKQLTGLAGYSASYFFNIDEYMAGQYLMLLRAGVTAALVYVKGVITETVSLFRNSRNQLSYENNITISDMPAV